MGDLTSIGSHQNDAIVFIECAWIDRGKNSTQEWTRCPFAQVVRNQLTVRIIVKVGELGGSERFKFRVAQLWRVLQIEHMFYRIVRPRQIPDGRRAILQNLNVERAKCSNLYVTTWCQGAPTRTMPKEKRSCWIALWPISRNTTTSIITMSPWILV